MGGDRYDRGSEWFRRCGSSGLRLSAISLGFWNNFGAAGTASHGICDESQFHEQARSMVLAAFDSGITSFDFANNYGPPPGAAEERFGKILSELPRRELVISSKAGYRMWPGPYGDGGTRKYLVSSCDESIKRLGVDYLDIFYHHRPDADTPLEESLHALDCIVRSGRALYVGLGSYPGSLVHEALRICERDALTRPIIHQAKYNMLARGFETDALPAVQSERIGVTCFGPLNQGVLTGKYAAGVPADSRLANPSGTLRADRVKQDELQTVERLRAVAAERGQSIAQMAVAWVIRHSAVTSAIIGASRPAQIIEAVTAAESPAFTREELASIDAILTSA